MGRITPENPRIDAKIVGDPLLFVENKNKKHDFALPLGSINISLKDIPHDKYPINRIRKNTESVKIFNLVSMRMLYGVLMRYFLMHTILGLMDTYFQSRMEVKKQICFSCTMNISKRRYLGSSIRDGEKKGYIVEDLQFLKKEMGYTDIKACVSDGSLQIASALNEVYPEVVQQRCLVHIQRQVKNYISGNPRTKAAKKLKHIMSYKILSDPILFPLVFQVWQKTYEAFLYEKTITKKGGCLWTHKNLMKAFTHIHNALPYMFQASKQSDPNIEQSSNKIEGYFGVFTEEGCHEHKGLSRSRLISFTALWIYLRNQK